MLVVDLLHEFEFGVWKALLFTYFMRQAVAQMTLWLSLTNGKFEFLSFNQSGSIQTNSTLLISTFGHGTIRTFAANLSEIKKLAARNFEDLLQMKLCPLF